MKSIFKIAGCAMAVAMMFALSGCRSSKPEANPYTGLMSSRNNVPPPRFDMARSNRTAPAVSAEAGMPSDNDLYIPSEIGGPEDSIPTVVEPADQNYYSEPGDVTASSADTDAQPKVSKPGRLVLPTVPAGEPIVGGGSSDGVYVVKKGDTLAKIAKNLGVKESDLKAANPQVKNFNRIFVGQKLNLPAGAAAGKASTPKVSDNGANAGATATVPADGIYTVCAGDSILKIAKRFGVKGDDIRRWNDLSSDKLVVGQKLRVKGDAAAVSKPASTPKTTVTAPKAQDPAPTDGAFVSNPDIGGDDASVELPIEDAEAPSAELPATEAVGQELPATEAEAAPAASAFTHVVIAGDTLEGIAELYDTTVEALLEANPQIKSNADLKDGVAVGIKLNGPGK